MERKTIGIEKRVSLGVLELALQAKLGGEDTLEYFHSLAMTGCTGENRAKKVVCLLNRMTTRNKLLPYIEEHRQEVCSMLKSKCDKPLFYVALMCSAYTFFYDTVAILGRFFHAQQYVTREYLLKKLSEIYGGNRALDVAFDCVVPMLVEAGFITRPKLGTYEIVRQQKFSESAKQIYIQSFLINNPYYQATDDIERQSYFEFITSTDLTRSLCVANVNVPMVEERKQGMS